MAKLSISLFGAAIWTKNLQVAKKYLKKYMDIQAYDKYVQDDLKSVGMETSIAGNVAYADIGNSHFEGGGSPAAGPISITAFKNRSQFIDEMPDLYDFSTGDYAEYRVTFRSNGSIKTIKEIDNPFGFTDQAESMGGWRYPGVYHLGGGNDRATMGSSLPPRGPDYVPPGDVVFGQKGHDWIQGGPGNDELYGGRGNDCLTSSLDDDSLFGGAGNDYLFDQLGNNLLVGGKGDDFLFVPGEGDIFFDDTLKGGKGNDVLVGGNGDDILSGGPGRDTFLFVSGGHRGRDVIKDYEKDRDEIIIVTSNPILPHDLEISHRRGDTVVTWGYVGEHKIIIKDVKLDESDLMPLSFAEYLGTDWRQDQNECGIF